MLVELFELSVLLVVFVAELPESATLNPIELPELLLELSFPEFETFPESATLLKLSTLTVLSPPSEPPSGPPGPP